eukprot:scaffold36618_cov275-Amphora_coffeaeformis.AAC.2
MMISSATVDGILFLPLAARTKETSRHDDGDDDDVEERPFLKRRYEQLPTEQEKEKEETWETQNDVDLVTTYAKQVRRIVEQTLLYRQTQRSACKKESKSGKGNPLS